MRDGVLLSVKEYNDLLLNTKAVSAGTFNQLERRIENLIVSYDTLKKINALQAKLVTKDSFLSYSTRIQPKVRFVECSVYKNIPIELLDAFKNAFGSKFRIRYRGGRIGKNDGRTRTQCHQDCTKANADRFSAY